MIDIVVGFFLLGAVARLLGSDLRVPTGLYQSCVMILLLAIGLKGGVALQSQSIGDILPKALAVVAFGLALPFIAFPILHWVGRWPKTDAAATAAHYGSVSVATYAVGVSVLELNGIDYEAYFPLFVALLEVPAILIGIILAKPTLSGDGAKKLAHEVFLNQGVLLLLGGITLGALGGAQTEKVMPLFKGLFHGILALFLLEMGRQAAEKLQALREQGAFLTTFAVIMPLIGGALGLLLASAMGLSAGGQFLLAVLGSSASYIAVPAAMAVALPKANGALAITASLGVTFPFNVLVALPIYLGITQRLA